MLFLAEVNDMNVRIGNEVTLTLDDLLNVTPHPAQTQAEMLTAINALFNIVT